MDEVVRNIPVDGVLVALVDVGNGCGGGLGRGHVIGADLRHVGVGQAVIGRVAGRSGRCRRAVMHGRRRCRGRGRPVVEVRRCRGGSSVTRRRRSVRVVHRLHRTVMRR